MNKAMKNTTALEVRSREEQLIWKSISSIFEEMQKLDDLEWETESEEDFDPGCFNELQTTFTLYNHIIYTTLSREGEALEFAIFADGSMAVRLHERCYGNHFLEIISAEEIFQINFDLLSKDISLLLKCFVFCSWHGIFDFLDNNTAWRDSLKYYLENYNIFTV